MKPRTFRYEDGRPDDACVELNTREDYKFVLGALLSWYDDELRQSDFEDSERAIYEQRKAEIVSFQQDVASTPFDASRSFLLTPIESEAAAARLDAVRPGVDEQASAYVRRLAIAAEMTRLLGQNQRVLYGL